MRVSERVWVALAVLLRLTVMLSRLRNILIIATLFACGKAPPEEQPPPAASPTQGSAPGPAPAAGDPVAAAKKIFNDRCVPCHGSTGQGDGPASASLNPKPRKYADVEWQASVTDEYIEKIIKYGGAAVGKSPAMPNNPDLTDPAVISALKDIIRAFGKK